MSRSRGDQNRESKYFAGLAELDGVGRGGTGLGLEVPEAAVAEDSAGADVTELRGAGAAGCGAAASVGAGEASCTVAVGTGCFVDASPCVRT
jgi:hypothetical protein